MNFKELRESCGLKQNDIVAKLNAEGIKANKSDISRLENGIIETYLFLSHKVAEILTETVSQGKGKNPTQAKFERLQLEFKDKIIYEYLVAHGRIDYPTARLIAFIDDDRKVRACISRLKEIFPIVELKRGWGLATSEAECNKQLAIYEKKKRIYSKQEAPLIAKRYSLKQEG